MCWRYPRDHVWEVLGGLVFWGARAKGAHAASRETPLLLEGYESRIVLSSGGTYIERSEMG